MDVLIAPGITTPVVLRFALLDGTETRAGTGQLGIHLAVGEDDAGVVPSDACVDGLRITELDYDQAGADDAELVEIVNAAPCDAVLADVLLELINGGDGQAYARIPLSRAGERLAPRSRLVVADESVRAALPEGVLSCALTQDLQNGAPDAVRLVAGARVLDAVSYEGIVASAAEGQSAPSDEGEGALARCPDLSDVGDNAADFVVTSPTPGRENVCP
jgi:hypothetical protein